MKYGMPKEKLYEYCSMHLLKFEKKLKQAKNKELIERLKQKKDKKAVQQNEMKVTKKADIEKEEANRKVRFDKATHHLNKHRPDLTIKGHQ